MTSVFALLLAVLTHTLQPAPRTFVLVVTGVGGEQGYSGIFLAAGSAFANAARTKYGVPDSSITFLAEDPSLYPTHVKAQSTKANVEKAVADIAGRAKPGDFVFVLLIGHGSSENGDNRFNIPGPDLTATDLKLLLGQLASQQVALVSATSATGDFVKALSGKGRAIVTATKSGNERNESKFAKYFVDAYAGDGADADKDGRVSLLEAFDFARREVAKSYEATNHLLTEHAQLDDNGDGAGTAAPDTRSPDGALAARMFLSPGARAVAAASNNPQAAALMREKDLLEARIDSLRRKKTQMDSTAYERALETLLLELATKNQALKALEKKP